MAAHRVEPPGGPRGGQDLAGAVQELEFDPARSVAHNLTSILREEYRPRSASEQEEAVVVTGWSAVPELHV